MNIPTVAPIYPPLLADLRRQALGAAGRLQLHRLGAQLPRATGLLRGARGGAGHGGGGSGGPGAGRLDIWGVLWDGGDFLKLGVVFFQNFGGSLG